MKRYKIAAVIIMVHAFVEIGGFFSVLPIWVCNMEAAEWMPFDAPSADVVIAGVIWGTLRLIGAIALWKNQMWGMVLSVINCVIAIALMMVMLPFGIMDGVLAGAALVLILSQYFKGKKISEGLND